MTAAVERAAALHADGHAATANMRPVQGTRLLRAALRLVGDAGADPAQTELRARILVSLAYAEAEQGHIDEGWRLLDEAEAALPPGRRGLVTTQRALLYTRTGRDEEAIREYGRALALLDEQAQPRQYARSLLNRGNLHLSRGHVRAARADLRRCAEVSAERELDGVLPLAIHGLGYLDYLVGDLPTALRTYREVADRYAVVKPGLLPVLALDRARALIAAGLFMEADEQLAFAVEQFRRHRLQQDHAEALLARAEAALLAGDLAASRRWALRARRQFLRRGNESWAALAALLALRGRPWTSVSAARAVTADARRLAETLNGLGLAEDARVAMLVAARGHLAAGERPEAERLVRVHAPRRGDRLDTRLLWRLARAGTSLAGGRATAASRDLTAGMAALHRYRGRLGCLDLQTGAAVHGRDLAAAGLALALAGGSLETIFRWSERSRAQALLLPPTSPPDDPDARAALEKLRHVRQTLREAEIAGRPAADLRARAAQLERGVREHAWSAAGSGPAAAPPIASPAAIRAELGDAAMVVYLRDRRRLRALVLTGRGSPGLVGLGDYESTAEAVYRLRADLDAQAGRRLPRRLAAAVAAATRRDAAVLADSVLRPLASALGDRELVIVPTGALVTVPWGVLPGGTGRPVTVTPSASVWLASRRRKRAGRGRTVLVAGPDIARGEAEIRGIRALYSRATVLIGAKATATATAAALDGATLAHVAAHGHHQTGNPLFSSLELTGGPLMGYDLQRLRAAPTTVVLSSCDLGLADVRPGDESIGMTSALLNAGTATVVASVSRVADDVASTVMSAFHRAGRRDGSPARALAAAGATEPASGFVCFGAS